MRGALVQVQELELQVQDFSPASQETLYERLCVLTTLSLSLRTRSARAGLGFSCKLELFACKLELGG